MAREVPVTDSSVSSQGPQNILVLRVVCFAFCLGVAIFAAAAIVMTNESRSPAFSNGALTQQAIDLGRLLSPAVYVLGMSMLAIWPFLRLAHMNTGRRVWQSSDPVDVRERKLFNGYSVISILRVTLAEGFGLFGVVAFFLTAQWITLTAPALSIALIVATMPSQARYERFLRAVTGP